MYAIRIVCPKCGGAGVISHKAWRWDMFQQRLLVKDIRTECENCNGTGELSSDNTAPRGRHTK